ncbi:MAG: ABC transporter permease [Bacillota bacterium]
MNRGINLRHAWIVFTKELSDTIRDRRTWWAMIILPIVIVPLMTLIGPRAAIKQIEDVQRTKSDIVVAGAERAPTLVQYLEASGQFNLVAADPGTAIKDRKAMTVIYVPADFEDTLRQEKPAQVRVAFDASDKKSSMVEEKVARVLTMFSQAVVTARLQARGYDPTILTPLAMNIENVAPKEQMGATFLGMILPMLMAMWAATGGLYAAIDVAAGEKERGTLEAILTVPVSRISLAFGKYLVVVVSSLIAAAISLIGFAVAFRFAPVSLQPGQTATFTLTAAQVGLIFLVALTLSAFFAAIELAVSSFARGFREAQAYLTPITFLVIIPWILTEFTSPADIPSWYYMVPVMNGVMAFKELVMGIINPAHIRDTLVFSALYVVVALRLAGRLFQRESVLFRS